MTDQPTPGELGRRLDRLEARLNVIIDPRALEETKQALEARLAHLESLVAQRENYRRNLWIAVAGAVIGVAGGLVAVLLAALVR